MSNFKSYGTRIFHKNLTISKKIPENLPGPGSYRAPSDFGYFEMTKFNDGTLENNFNMTSPRIFNGSHIIS